MFTINSFKENGLSYIELKNSKKTAKAKICLDEGARLQELKFGNHAVIKDIPNFEYKDSFASSLLFPFASRIEEGKYQFKGNEYQFNCNDNGKNALHGLIYNKKFEVSEVEEFKNRCTITLNYAENNKSKGFPFKYLISLTYTLFEDRLKLQVSAKNIDSTSFPFILGWHPYFVSEDIENSTLEFKSDQKIIFDENLITKKVEDHKTEEIFKIEDKQLDDCFILNHGNVKFTTPKYQLEITTDKIENYLQLYTPKNLPIIAIEPMTGISNSFNNKIGLEVLEPNETYTINWNLDYKRK